MFQTAKLGILDAIIEWICSSIMGIFDLFTAGLISVLDCNLTTFERVFKGVDTTYQIFQAIAIGLILIFWITEVFKSIFAPLGIEAEDPIQTTFRSCIFIFFVIYSKPLTNLVLDIGATPYKLIGSTNIDSIECSALGNAFYSVITVVSGVTGVGLILILILLCLISWNYFKFVGIIAKQYVVLGILFYTAPLPFAMGATKQTTSIFSSWCRMFGGQLILLTINVWLLKIFTSMVDSFLHNPFIVMG